MSVYHLCVSLRDSDYVETLPLFYPNLSLLFPSHELLAGVLPGILASPQMYKCCHILLRGLPHVRDQGRRENLSFSGGGGLGSLGGTVAPNCPSSRSPSPGPSSAVPSLHSSLTRNLAAEVVLLLSHPRTLSCPVLCLSAPFTV